MFPLAEACTPVATLGLAQAGAGNSVHAIVTRALATKILRGIHPPGTLLPPEARLLEEFRISRTVLREALKTLAAKGMVVSRTKVGTRVLPRLHWNMLDPQLLAWRVELGVDKEFLLKVFELRQSLEPAAAALAATHRDARHIESMRECLDAMERPYHTRESYSQPDLAFHEQVLMASANPFMQRMVCIIDVAIRYSFRISAPVDDPARLRISVERHRRILDAIEARNPLEAASAMTHVIEESIENAHYDLAVNPISVTMPLGSSPLVVS